MGRTGTPYLQPCMWLTLFDVVHLKRLVQYCVLFACLHWVIFLVNMHWETPQ